MQETSIVKNILKNEQNGFEQGNFTKPVGERRLKNLRAKLLKLLDGATDHPAIEAALPNCEQFFKSISADDFVALLRSVEHGNPIYTALWYHAGLTMRKATNQCALFGKERMMLLYPLWRFYADESDTYR